MPIFLNSGQTAWEIYWRSIENLLGGSGNYTVIQPLAIASRIEFDSGYPRFNLYLKRLLGDTIPTWGPLYRNTAGLTVEDSYRSFMDKLNESVIGEQSAEDRRRLGELDNQRKDIRVRIRQKRREIKEAWEEYQDVTPTGSRVSYNRWLQEEGYETEFGNLQRELEAINGRYLVVFNNTGGVVAEIGRATAALEASTSKYRLPSSADEEDDDPDTWTEFLKTNIQVDIQRFKQDSSATTVSVNESQQRSTNISRWWGGGGSVNYGWFGFGGGFGGSSSHTQIIRDAEERTASIEITFNNVASFPIIREPWFKEGLIRQYASRIPRSFWEASGILNLVPTSVLLGHGLKLSVNTTSEISHYYFESHRTSGRAGFRLGPWSFGGSGGSSSTYENTRVDITDTGFSVQDVSGRAMLIAVSSFRPVDLLPAPTPFRPLELVKGRKAETKEQEDAEMRAAFKKFEAELAEFGLNW